MLSMLALAAVGACDQPKAPVQLYFSTLQPPIGLEVDGIQDLSENLPTGGTITVVGVIKPDADRDRVDRLLASFYRQASDRRGFRGGVAERIDIRVYGSAAAARAGGEDWLAQVVRLSAKAEPQYTNRLKAPLLKWIQQALGPQPQYTGSLKPIVVVDADKLTAEVTIPFVKIDGSGTYVEELTLNNAMTTFTSTVSDLFDRVSQLQQLTFIGRHRDEVAMRVWLSRQQYQELNPRQLEEKLGEFRGKYINQLMAGQISDKAVEQKILVERRKLYREAFARLPAEQVSLSKALR